MIWHMTCMFRKIEGWLDSCDGDCEIINASPTHSESELNETCEVLIYMDGIDNGFTERMKIMECDEWSA